MEFSLSAAAKATGKGKSTIHNAIKTGKLSARRTDDGSYQIDGSELGRVFSLNPLNGSKESRPDDLEPHAELAGTELVVLRFKVSALEGQLSRERETFERQLTHERDTYQETVSDLRKRLDRAEERILALAPPPVTAAAERASETSAMDDLRRRLEQAEDRLLALAKPSPTPSAEAPVARMVETAATGELKKWFSTQAEESIRARSRPQPAPAENPLDLGPWRVS
jgi:hypothetical protein